MLTSFFKFKKNSSKSKGFTLVEILVAISLLSLLSVVSIPAFRNYSQSRELDDAALDLFRIVKQVQNMGLSGVNCLGNKPYNVGWILDIDSTTYTIKALCAYNPSLSIDTKIYKDNGSFLVKNIAAGTISELSSCDIDTDPDDTGDDSDDIDKAHMAIKFNRKKIEYKCKAFGGVVKYSPLDTTLNITLEKTSTDCRQISILPGGTINYIGALSTCP